MLVSIVISRAVVAKSDVRSRPVPPPLLLGVAAQGSNRSGAAMLAPVVLRGLMPPAPPSLGSGASGLVTVGVAARH